MNAPSSQDLLAKALLLLDRGWSMLPSSGPKKGPCVKWKSFQETRPTADQIRAWDRMFIPERWGVVTGKLSGVVVVDFDGDSGRVFLKQWGLTPHVRTGSGGYHIYLKHPGFHVPTMNAKSSRRSWQWPGVDLRADGGFAVLLGRNQRGMYEILRDLVPESFEVLPAELREFLKASDAKNTPGPGVQSTGSAERVSPEIMIRRAVDEVSSSGRNNAGFWLAGQLRDNGYTQAEAESIMREYRLRVPATNTKNQPEPYTEHESLASLQEAYRVPPRLPWTRRSASGDASMATANRQNTPTERPNLLHFPYTDTGNAERLSVMCGTDFRYCVQMKRWLLWDGRRWNLQDSWRVKALVKKTMRTMFLQAADIEDRDRRKAAEKHARRSESAAAINAALSCAEYEDGVAISANDLDRHPYLLNCLNGTLDLRTGNLREHRREDLISKLVHFNYNPDAKCRTFLRFIDQVMGGGPDASEQILDRANRLVSYLQKCFGYALTGDVSEKAIFCFFGSGNNGKTTLLEASRFVVAEYSGQVLIDTLMAHHNRESNASLADLADLRGARFVTTSEAEEGQRLAVGKLKYLSQGMGGLKTCRKYENPIEFAATHKLFLDANHRPIIRGLEKAVWNRLKPIPFLVEIQPQEIDRDFLNKLKVEAEGILAWMVMGCQLWVEQGLGEPPEVTEASATWRAESDRFPTFLKERCVVEPKVWMPVSQLWPAYQNWCEANGEKYTLPKTAFDERLEQLGCKQAQRDNGKTRAWVGIRFRTSDDLRDVEAETVTK